MVDHLTMKKPRLEAVYFGGDEYIRLAKVLELSAIVRLGDRWDINVVKVDGHEYKAALRSKYVRQGLFSDNAHKSLHWSRIVNESEDGDCLLLIDVDTYIRDSLDEIWSYDFDVALTTRDYKWPINSGVVFVRVNSRSKLFFKFVAQETIKMLGDANYHLPYEEKYGGIHQAAIGYVLDNKLVNDLNVLEIPCSVWNSEHTSRVKDNLDEAKIIHFLPSGRRKLKTKRPEPNIEWSRIINEWRYLEKQIYLNMRWDEILNRLNTLDSDKLKIAEIGVWKGELSTALIQSPNIRWLILVDPWKACNKQDNPTWFMSGSKLSRLSQSRFNEAFSMVSELAEKHSDRIFILREKSESASKKIFNDSLDLVFIDGDHSYQGVINDISLWMPKVKVGGYISGHDYEDPRFPGVKQAVLTVFDRDEIEIGEDFTWFVKVTQKMKSEFPQPK